ncbi:MAG: hypothetical protein AB1810_03550 [Pseudomonadota bacterium]
MNIAQQLHPVRIKPPFFQTGQGTQHCGLHRYLDADFVNRFKQDVQRRQFSLTQFTSWQNDERHSRFGQEPVLRLPLHRAFHIVSCEVVCERLGHPALDPQKITSAGFVIRKRGAGRELAWMLEDGDALGWQEAPTELRDPDINRRLCASGVLHKRGDQPAYSGEEVHPLHVLKTTDAAGKTHTLLYGYVPLGGFHYHRDPNAAVDAQSQQQVLNAAAEFLPWPFGFRKPLNQTWLAEHTRPVDQGRPSKPMFELLRLLVNRYHLGESNIAENASLERYCSGLWFHDLSHLPSQLRQQGYTDSNHGRFTTYRRLDLLSYLKACFNAGGDNPLVRWIIQQEQRIDQAGGLDKLAELDKLPNSSGSGTLGYSLLMLAADAQEIRTLLNQRLRDQTLSQVKEIPLPKFTQGSGDLYQIVPFVRSLTDSGREQIVWADASARSIAFRVAAPFDPEASRPSLIQMPSLADLKRGLAKGAAMITPADTFNLIDSLKLNKGAGPDALPDSTPGPGLGIQWICSFSLPVITLVAMILLMIMITLLNIVFFWLPWVRICLPFPKMK